MKLNIYSIFDSAAKAYAPPFFLHNDGLAVRGFQDNVNNPESQAFRNPDQFTLFHIGTYDDITGVIESAEVIRSMGNGLEYKTAIQDEDPVLKEIAYIRKLLEEK
jgi:hypothetical protein